MSLLQVDVWVVAHVKIAEAGLARCNRWLVNTRHTSLTVLMLRAPESAVEDPSGPKDPVCWKVPGGFD